MHLWLHLSTYSCLEVGIIEDMYPLKQFRKQREDEGQIKWTQIEELRTNGKFWKILIKKDRCFHYFNWLFKEWTEYNTWRDNYVHAQFLIYDHQIGAITIRMTSRRQQRDTLSCNSFLPSSGCLQPRYSSPKPHHMNPFRKNFHHLISFRSVGLQRLPSSYYFFLNDGSYSSILLRILYQIGTGRLKD